MPAPFTCELVERYNNHQDPCPPTMTIPGGSQGSVPYTQFCVAFVYKRRVRMKILS